MCGRFTRTSPAEAIVDEFAVRAVGDVDLRPRYNLCPGETVAGIAQHAGERRLGALRWGFPPRGAINLRSESAERRYYDAVRRRRCLIVADGFYEWRTEGSVKMPYLFRLISRRPFAFAALWGRWGDAPAAPGAAILTCSPNEIVAPIHDRMPVVLTGDACRRWLEGGGLDSTQLGEPLRPFPADQMESYPVSLFVNSSQNDSPECIPPASRL